ncbi:archaeosortase/exosortase family protein [Candidatus Latescibacterota bacterium]
MALTATARTQLRTIAVFFALLGAFSGVYQFEKRVSGRYLDLPYTRLVTIASQHLGQVLLPFPVGRRGDITLATGGAAVVIRGGCNGIEALFLLLAGVLAVPAPWRRRAEALALYLPLLFVLNLFRVLMLLYIMARYPDLIDLFHYQIGQGIMILFVLAFWLHHVRRVQA